MPAWFDTARPVIDIICNVFTAFGTVGAVITALWLARKDKPKLKVYATMYVFFSDEMQCEYIGMRCVNAGQSPIICTGFALNPKKSNYRIMMAPRLEVKISGKSTTFPKTIQYSDEANAYFDIKCIDTTVFKSCLSPYKWLAKLQLKWRWRVVALTNVKGFEGKLSGTLIEKIIAICFSGDKVTNKQMSESALAKKEVI
jgi:hypothetical protein